MTNNESGSQDQKKKSQFNEMILGGVKSRSGKETTKWINDLTSENMDEIAESAPNHNPGVALPAQFSHPSIAQTQVKWVDKLFDLFSQYEVEYNRATQSPDLQIQTERAVITPELVGKMQGSDHHHYTGRLHCRKWSLIIRGNLSHIEGYVIPADHLIGFENNIQAYTQFFEFMPVWDGELKWSFDKRSISLDQLPQTAKQIFGHLVKVSRGEADADEQFGKPGLSSMPPKPMGDDQFQSQSKTRLLSDASSPSSNAAPDYLLRHGGVFEDEQPIQSLKNPSPDLTSADQATTTKLPREERANRASQSQTSKMKAAAKAAQNPTPTGGQKKQEDSVAPCEAEIPGEIDMAKACEILSKSIDFELEKLSKLGAKAFEQHDFSEVEKLMKKTSKLKSMRDEIANTINEWKKMLAEG